MINLLMCCFNEVWLARLAVEMKDTLQMLLKDCMNDGKSSSNGVDPNKYPSQVRCIEHC